MLSSTHFKDMNHALASKGKTFQMQAVYKEKPRAMLLLTREEIVT